MKRDPWVKLILVSLGGIVISLSLLWTLQTFNSYRYYNGYQMQGRMNYPVQQGMNMQMDSSQMMGNMH